MSDGLSQSRLEKTLGTIHLPEMVFGDNSLELLHEATGAKIHFNALDALRSWRQESLPPVQIPAAAKWKFRTYGLSSSRTKQWSCIGQLFI